MPPFAEDRMPDIAPKFQQGGMTPAPGQVQAAPQAQPAQPQPAAPQLEANQEAQAFGDGGKVSGGFGWPVSDARNRGKS